MKIEKHAYRKSIPNAFYMDQMKVLSAAKKCTFLQYLCDKTTISMCKNMHYDQTIHNGLKALNAMVTKMYSAYNICMKAKEKFG